MVNKSKRLPNTGMIGLIIRSFINTRVSMVITHHLTLVLILVEARHFLFIVYVKERRTDMALYKYRFNLYCLSLNHFNFKFTEILQN